MSLEENITFVIPFRNVSNRDLPLLHYVPECVALRKTLLLLIDDNSTDNSFSWLQNVLASYHNIQILQSPYQQGKKFALRYGIEQATTTYVWLSDIDVLLPSLSGISLDKKAELLILPLQMKEQDGLLCRLQNIEYIAIQTLTLLSAQCGHPVMCSAANLLVKRQCWLQSFPYLHTELPSGDDMFLLEACKRNKKHIKPLYGTTWTATVYPETTLKGLLRQRMRWAGKAPAYTDADILLCGAWVILSNFLALFPPFFIIKYIADVCLIRYGIRHYQFTMRATPGYALLLSLVYPWYILYVLLGGIFHKKRW